MSLLQERSNRTEEILQGRFIKSSLSQTAREIDKLQRQAMSGFKSDFWNRRTFSTSSEALVLTHDMRERFVDMKTRMKKDGSKYRKKSYAVHNKIIWGQYNYLIRELAYGYTDAAKAELIKLSD